MYVGGMCIARTKKHYTNTIKINLGNPDKNAIERLLNAKNNVMFKKVRRQSWMRETLSMISHLKRLKNAKTRRNALHT